MGEKEKRSEPIIIGGGTSSTFKLDVHDLIKQAIKQEKEKSQPELNSLGTYMLIYTTEYADISTASDYDFEKAQYIGEVEATKVKFTLLDHTGAPNEELILEGKDYGQTWVAVLSTTIFGSMLENEHSKLLTAALGNMPPEWKDKIKVR